MVASLLTHREIHFLDPLVGIWREDPFIDGYSDATVEVMVPIKCGPTFRDTTLGHHIWGCVGASNIEQWITGGHGGAWWCTVVCWIALWSRSVLHHIEYRWGMTGVSTQTRHGTVRGGIAVGRDILWCTEIGLCLVYLQI